MTLFNTVWGQCNARIKSQLRVHKYFEDTKKEGSVVGLIKIVDQVCLSGKFGTVQDQIYWIITQNRKLVTYTKLK